MRNSAAFFAFLILGVVLVTIDIMVNGGMNSWLSPIAFGIVAGNLLTLGLRKVIEG